MSEGFLKVIKAIAMNGGKRGLTAEPAARSVSLLSARWLRGRWPATHARPVTEGRDR
jgi:hypothetical protein